MASASLLQTSAVRKDESVAPRPDPGFTPINVLLRMACDEAGWKYEAVAAAIGRDYRYFSKQLAGDKAIGARDLMNLPDDIEAIFARLYAEQFGLLVVQPLEGPDAIKAFVSGCVGMLSNGILPLRASRMAKAGV